MHKLAFNKSSPNQDTFHPSMTRFRPVQIPITCGGARSEGRLYRDAVDFEKEQRPLCRLCGISPFASRRMGHPELWVGVAAPDAGPGFVVSHSSKVELWMNGALRFVVIS